MAGKRWTQDETKMAFALYFLIPTDEIDKKGAEVWRLSEALGRTPRAVAMKLWNIAALDENRIVLGKNGLRHGSSLDSAAWEEYRKRGEDYIWEGIELLDSALSLGSLSSPFKTVERGLREGGETLTIAKHRINQGYFRNCLLQNYGYRCCLTGLGVRGLLRASHIKPWAACETAHERVDPKNGLLLNALHDQAFDLGLITLNREYEIVVSQKVVHDEQSDEWLWKYNGVRINLPLCNLPSVAFIEYHQDCIFQH